MKGKLIALPAVLIICALITGSFLFPTAAGTLETTSNLLTNDKSAKSGNIPDNIAYELFFRTVAEGNARGLVKRAGFDNDEDIERVMKAVYSINQGLELADERAREIRENRNKFSDNEIKTDLSKLRAKKDEMIEREITRSLPGNLGEKGINNLRNFINSDVKSRTKVISSGGPQKSKDAFFIKTSGEFLSKMPGSGGVYFYCAGWQEGMTVYGSGSLYEDLDSGISYRVTTTVTSPSAARSNTTASDWGYSPIVNSSGLSVDIEDGTYTVDAVFEQQNGAYDEYGSLQGGSGGSALGSETASVVVAPAVSITGIDPSTDVELRRGDQKTFKVAVQATGGVPAGTQVFLEFNEVANFSNVTYSVDDRTKIATVSSAGGTTNVPFLVEIGDQSNTGNVLNKGRIDHATAPGGANVDVGTRESANMSFTVRLNPTSNCGPECYEFNPLCPCYGQGGGGGLGKLCDPTPTATFVKAGFSTKPAVPFCNCTSSPIVIDIVGNGFALTSAAAGVPFDFNGDGIVGGKLGWTNASSDDAWLVLDRNQNNLIDSGKELFGNATPQPDPPAGEERQGFLALAEYDRIENGGDGDGKITRRDRAFKKLRLWQDRNHNGISEAEELFRLPALDIVAIFLDYHQSKRTDEYGNRFKYRARVRDSRGANVGRWAWDVFVVTTR